MAAIIIIAVIVSAIVTGSVSICGFHTYRSSHDWRHLVGAILYGVACIIDLGVVL